MAKRTSSNSATRSDGYFLISPDDVIRATHGDWVAWLGEPGNRSEKGKKLLHLCKGELGSAVSEVLEELRGHEGERATRQIELEVEETNVELEISAQFFADPTDPDLVLLRFSEGERGADDFVQRLLASNQILAEQAKSHQSTDYEDWIAPDLLAFVNPKSSEVLECNQTATERLPDCNEEIVGRPLSDLYDPSCHETVKGALAEMIEKGIKHQMDLPLTASTGESVSVWLEMAINQDPEVDLDCYVVWRETQGAERHQMEQRYRERTSELLVSEERFSLLSKIAPVGIYLTDSEGECLHINERLEAMLGLTCEEAKGSGWITNIHPAERDKTFQKWQTAAAAGERFRVNFRVLKPDGEIVHLQSVGDPVKSASGGEVMGYIGTALDRTEMVTSRKKLEMTGEQLEIATKAAGLGIWDWDITEGTLHWDQQMLEIYGVKRRDFRGSYDDWKKCLHPMDASSATARVTEALEKCGEFLTDFRIIRETDGKTRHIAGRGKVVETKDRKASRMIGVNYDVTDRKSLEEAGMEIAVRERNRIGQYLHERICQDLYGAAVLISKASESLQRENHSQAELIEKVSSILSESLKETRLISHVISPLAAESKILSTALRSFVEKQQMLHKNIHFDLRIDPELLHLTGSKSTQLYFIASEAVFNAIQHASPSNIELALLMEDQFVSLVIDDDGGGCTDDLAYENLGLRSMANRAMQIDATFFAGSNPANSGIRVQCRVDLSKLDSNEHDSDFS